MNKRTTQALETFSSQYNCAQSVLSVFAEELGLTKDLALKLSCPFGAGLAFRQETCGAISGSIMAIGLKYGNGISGSVADKETAYDMTTHLITEFKKLHKTICCRELLDGMDMSTPEGIARLHEMDMFRKRCAAYVEDAVRITEKIIGCK
ncbi:MAG: C-GCAxxG-C-C family protein [Bacteroidota bacterium]